MTHPFRPALLGALLALSLALGTAACSGDDEPDPGAEPTAPGQETDNGREFEIETVTTIGRVVGRLPRRDLNRLERKVTGLVQGWFNAAFVGGDYPRSDFRKAFPGFTAGARAEARREQRLLTNRGLGSRIDEVTPTASRIRLDVLAVNRRAVGATARFLLEFRTEGKADRRVRVQGRLLLTREAAGWRIFGYDVAKGSRP
jgi:hypothetical protein